MTDTTTHTPDAPETDEVSATPSRRQMFVGGAAATAAAVVAGSALGARTVEAANGDAIIAGEVNISTDRTELIGPSFVVTDGEASGSLAREVVPGVVTGVHGFTSRDDDSRAVWGLDQTIDGVGVYGQHWDRTPGIGVLAESGSGPGLVAQGSGADVVLRGSGELRFAADSAVNATSAGQIGTMARNDDGTLWYCYSQNRWQRLAGPVRSSTFTPIDPTRVYDSRSPQPNPGALGSGGQIVVSTRSGRDIETGGVIDSALVPFDATAVSYNLTIVNTIGSGFLSVAPADSTSVKASSINWTNTGQVLANAGVVKLDANGNVRVTCGGPAGATDFIIDITGYHA